MDALSALRAATHDRHHALDASDWFARATNDLETYARHVALLADFYARAERALDAFTVPLTVRGFDPIARRKGAALATERSELPPVSTSNDEAGSAFPDLHTESAAIGSFYVLEGSTLGGTVLAGRIRERLGWTSRFYGIYGARTGAMWHAFVAALHLMGDEIDPDSLVEGAIQTFDAYAWDIAGRASIR